MKFEQSDDYRLCLDYFELEKKIKFLGVEPQKRWNWIFRNIDNLILCFILLKCRSNNLKFTVWNVDKNSISNEHCIVFYDSILLEFIQNFSGQNRILILFYSMIFDSLKNSKVREKHNIKIFYSYMTQKLGKWKWFI